MHEYDIICSQRGKYCGEQVCLEWNLERYCHTDLSMSRSIGSLIGHTCVLCNSEVIANVPCMKLTFRFVIFTIKIHFDTVLCDSDSIYSLIGVIMYQVGIPDLPL